MDPGALENSLRKVVGTDCIVMENAVIRSTDKHSLSIGNHCLIGPHAHLVGCTIADDVFIATGAFVFHGADPGPKSEVRVNGVVHLRTELPAEAVVPIGWVAVGRPAVILPRRGMTRYGRFRRTLIFRDSFTASVAKTTSREYPE